MSAKTKVDGLSGRATHYAVTETPGLSPDRARISASGELDLAAAGRLSAVLEEHCVPVSFVQLDLSRVTFLDCACLRVLEEEHRRYRAAGGALVLTGVGSHVERLLGLTGLDRTLFTITEWSLARARASR